jgi:hypothetical protein
MRRGVVLLAALAAVTGCGGGDDSSKPKSGKPKASGAIPSALTGTYTVKLTKADLPPPAKAPPEFKPAEKPYDWRIEITRTGGLNNGPVLNIVSPTHGSLESPVLSVKGDQLKLSQEECGGDGYTFVNTTYRWVREGAKLTLTKLSGGCADKVAETILTSRPLTRVP